MKVKINETKSDYFAVWKVLRQGIIFKTTFVLQHIIISSTRASNLSVIIDQVSERERETGCQ